MVVVFFKVYPKSHQKAVKSFPERFFGASPPPCGVNDVRQNHKHSLKLNIRVPSLVPYS